MEPFTQEIVSICFSQCLILHTLSILHLLKMLKEALNFLCNVHPSSPLYLTLVTYSFVFKEFYIYYQV